MATSTATIERINLITSVRPMTETPVESINSEADDGVDYSIPLYVTSTEYEHRAEKYVGKVIKVRRRIAREDSWWAWDEEDTINVSVKGAKLNPDMVNGRYYRSLDGHGMLVRYNDDDHEGDRNLESCSLSIISTNGETWPIPGDGTNWTDNVEYIEVERPASEPVTEVVADPGFALDLSALGPTRGFAKLDNEDRAALKPEPVPGTMYLMWAERPNEEWRSDRNTYVAVTWEKLADGSPLWDYLGYYVTGSSNEPRYFADVSCRPNATDLENDRMVWVEAALTTPEPDATAEPSSYYALQGTEETAFEELNEALNELADDNDWCSDYESIIEPLGMNGRNKDCDWDVEVRVDFTFTDSNPSGEFDENAATRHGIDGLVINSAEYSATATINVRVDDTSEDGARDYVDTDMVENELNSMLRYASDVDVSDYTITDTTKVD